MPQSPNTPTEYGGKPGMIQSVKDGHVLTPAEQLSLVNQEHE